MMSISPSIQLFKLFFKSKVFLKNLIDMWNRKDLIALWNSGLVYFCNLPLLWFYFFFTSFNLLFEIFNFCLEDNCLQQEERVWSCVKNLFGFVDGWYCNDFLWGTFEESALMMTLSCTLCGLLHLFLVGQMFSLFIFGHCFGCHLCSPSCLVQ